MRKRVFPLILPLLVVFVFCPLSVFATEDEENDEQNSSVTEFDDHLLTLASETEMNLIDVPQDGYRLGELYNADNNGYSESDPIDGDDYHFGWQIGHFYVSGYTRPPDDSREDNVFLKTPGDRMRLYFVLETNIDDCTPEGRDISISDDDNGYDENFGVGKVDFGRGTVIIKYTDPLNQEADPIVYTDFLTSCHSGMATMVDLFEEGDYEVTLDYELKVQYKTSVLRRTEYHYPNYKITFNFKVRNGNCMVYLFDSETERELPNESITPNGFMVSLANSKYLQIDAQRYVLNEGANGVVLDTRFNKPVRDGSVITEEGIYEITVTNIYTGSQTKKTVYVGSDQVLMAYVATDYSIEEINYLLGQGATVNPDGSIFSTPTPTPTPTPEPVEVVVPAVTTTVESVSAETVIDESSATEISSVVTTDTVVGSTDTSVTNDDNGTNHNKASNKINTTPIIIAVAAIAVVASFVWTQVRINKIKNAALDPIRFEVNTEKKQDDTSLDDSNLSEDVSDNNGDLASDPEDTDE